MNKERILQSAEKIFGKIDKVGIDLYKGIWHIKNKTAGIYYIDVSGKIADDFQQYQENVLAKDYYENPGPVQWNYYLMLLQDEVNSETKKNLEMDDRFARKLVLNENQFADYFSLEKVLKDEKINPVAEWKVKLDAVDLQEIHGAEPVATVLTRFENNTTKKLKTKTAKRVKADDLNTIDKISYLKLNENYRKYPAIKEFVFGSVNLVTGINGVGKTSLFEAVEMMICGRYFRGRQNKRNEPGGSIEARFNDSKNLIKFDPSSASNERYRLRDQKWYANNRAREHELDISFNRYNFFSADAAFHFSNSDSREAVREALLNIVLGPEYDHIMQRMDKAFSRLRPQLNGFETGIEEATSEKLQAEKDIEAIKKDSNLDSFRDAVKEGLLSISFINYPDNIDSSAIELEQAVNRLLIIVENVKNQEWAFSIKDINARQSELDGRRKRFEEFQGFLKDNNDKKAGFERVKERLHVVKILLSDCMPFFSDERLFRLEGSAEKIRSLETEKVRISRIKLFLEAADIETISSSLSFVETFKNVITSLNLASVDEINYTNRKANYLKTAGETEELIQQIKTLGRKYIKLNTAAGDCPLCQTRYNTAQLTDRIEHVLQLPDQKDSLELKDISDSLSEVESRIKNLQQKKSHLELLSSALNAAGISEDLPMSKTLENLRQFVNRETEIDIEIQELKNIIQLSKDLKLSESGSTFLKEKLTEIPNLPEFSFANKALFEKALANINIRIAKEDGMILQLIEERTKQSFMFKSNSGLPTDVDFTAEEVKQMFDAAQRKLDHLNVYFKQVKEIIRINDDADLVGFQLPIELLQNSIQSLRIELTNQLTLRQAQGRYNEAEAKLKSNTEGLKRFKPACDTLKKILDDRGGEQVNLFFERNLAQIMDIFQSIHSPREFIDMKLKNNTLFLKTEDGTEREITAISTGQRSALALSIFLTLNRKLQNGPDIIMFDDPVSFIDDLNAVSFLDFLRYFVLNENKQIFFATANKRLANLFEKKFSFLGEQDFRKWELKR